MQRLPRLVALLLLIGLCALIAFWVTRVLRGTPIAVPPTVAPVAAGGSSRVDEVLASARLFGSRRPGALSDNVRALGIVADQSGHGSVIVSVDGQAPKVYRVGDTLDGRMVAAIRAEEVELDANGARQVFRLPAQRATTGLTIVGGGSGASGANDATMPQQTPQEILQPPPGAPAQGIPSLPPSRGREQDRLRAMQQRSDMPAPPAAGLNQ
jgi:hypothetical protein